MKQLLVLIRPSPEQVWDLRDVANNHGVHLNEIMPNVLVVETDSSATAERALSDQLRRTAYLLASYDAPYTNADDWKEALGDGSDRSSPEYSGQDRYVILHRVGGDATFIDFDEQLSSHVGIAARELIEGVSVARPSEAQAGRCFAALRHFVDDFDGDTAVARMHPFTASVPI